MLETFPTSTKDQAAAVAKLAHAFRAADDWRESWAKRWLRWYELYHAYSEAEDKAEDNWRSKIYIPAIFYVIETVAPRLVAQMPEPTVEPVEGTDVTGARGMEKALQWSAESTGAYLHVVASMKDALAYGSGFMKTYAGELTSLQMRIEPQYEDVVAPIPVVNPETGEQLRDLDGELVIEEQVIGQREVGQPKRVWERVPYYRGPICESVDPFNFWVSPEASSIDDSRWAIHRVFMSREDFEQEVQAGYYQVPEGMSPGEFYAQVDDPRFEKYAAVGLGSRPDDPTFDCVELLEFWTDGGKRGTGKKVCMVNRSAVVAVTDLGFAHGQKPFIKLDDHFQQHEIYGIGEIQMLEGLQDEVNALINSRIDAVKLAMNLMFFVDEDALVSTKDLRIRPGGRVRVRNRYGLPLNQIISKIEFGDVTSSAYVEVGEAMQMMERISGTSGPPGPEDPAVYRTATGVVNIAEGMQARYAHKLKTMELTGFNRLWMHFGTLLQQYMDKPMFRRLLGEEGEWDHIEITPESIQGRFDYKTLAESSAMTETARRELSLLLFDRTAADPYFNPLAARENLLQTHGIKNITTWLAERTQLVGQMLAEMSPEDRAMVAQQLAQMMAMEQGQGGAPVDEGAGV